MKNGLWSKVRRFAALGCVAFTAAGVVYAQEPLPQVPAKDPIGELKSRLDRLEQENKELRQLVGTGSPVSLQQPGGMDPKAVEKIVADYIKAEDKKKKDAEDKKKKEDDAKGAEVGKDFAMTARWNNGLELRTKDQAFKVHVGGRVHQDWGWFDVDQNIQNTGPGVVTPNLSIGDVRDAANFRRVRLRVDGTCWEVLEWVTEVDFASGSAVMTDVYMKVTQLPFIGSISAGHFKEPFSLEELTSSRYITFMERSLLNQAFVPSRNIGILAQNTYLDDSVNLAVGFFRTNSDNQGLDQGDGEYSVTGRLAASPVFENDGRCLLHLGVAGSYRNLEELNSPTVSTVAFASNPEIRIGFPSGWANTGNIAASNFQLFGLEAAAQYGPWNIQAEYVAAHVDRFFATPTATDPGDPTFFGWYVQTSYFLTGEHRPYKRSSAAFDRVKPHENFFLVGTGEDGNCGTCCGKGAWEIALRYSQLDLDEETVDGGNIRDFTVGLNWYLNPNFKVQWNYIYSHRDVRAASVAGVLDPKRFDGDAHIFAARIAFDF